MARRAALALGLGGGLLDLVDDLQNAAGAVGRRSLFYGLPQGFAAMRYHSLAVDRDTLPDCLEISAEADDGEIMGLRHRTMPIETVQYHPESIGTPEGMRQMQNFLEMARGKDLSR